MVKRSRKLCDKRELSEDIKIDILHRLPSKSLARFKCVSRSWQKYISDSSSSYSCRSRRWRPQPELIGIFYQTRKLSKIGFFSESMESSSRNIDLNESVNFLNKKVYIVASSNDFLLCTKHRRSPRVYYVYNPATRQHLALPKTQICMENGTAVGFSCKVDDSDKDVISFTVVRYEIPRRFDLLQSSVTIECFSSETNVWTANNLTLDVPLTLNRFNWDGKFRSAAAAGVIDGVFCWLDRGRQITFYDSVYKCFWALELPEEMVFGESCYLGLSGGALYFALNCGDAITVWHLESHIRSRDAVVWVRKYDAEVAATVMQCPEAFGLGGDTLRVKAFGLTGSLNVKVQNMAIHPDVPHIFYLDVRGKVISYDLETDIAQFVYDFGEPWWKTKHYRLFAYEWHQWPRLL